MQSAFFTSLVCRVYFISLSTPRKKCLDYVLENCDHKNGMFLMKNLQKKENQNYEKKPSKDRKIEAYLCMSRFS